MRVHLRVTEHHLPYGITQYHLPDTGGRVCSTMYVFYLYACVRACYVPYV